MIERADCKMVRKADEGEEKGNAWEKGKKESMDREEHNQANQDEEEQHRYKEDSKVFEDT